MPSALRAAALRIFRAGLAAADPVQAVRRQVAIDGNRLVVGRKTYRLDRLRNIYAIGAGKASAAMAAALEDLLGDRISGGAINVKRGDPARLRRIEVYECGHPVPDENGVRGAARIAEIARLADRRDLLVCLISGGASALLPAPAPPVTLEQKRETTRLLLACGADIHEINCVRKHLSLLKGGQLARLAFPSPVAALILSDVIGDNLDVIGSGPTAPDPSTYAEAAAILNKYGLARRAPRAVWKRLTSGAARETPKPGDRVFQSVHNVIAGSNRLAVDAAAEEARRLGFDTLVLSTYVQGEAREVARAHASIAKEIACWGRPLRPPACVISGGETTVTIRGGGLGGRSQEFALAAAIDIAGLKRVALLSAGTDGSDGPTDAAGAVVDGGTVGRAKTLGLNAAAFLANNDSYRFFQPLGGLIQTGPTGTNVMDIQIVLVGGGGRPR